jgi:transposase
MEQKFADVAPRNEEVPVVEADAVRDMKTLREQGWGFKRIAKEIGVARNTVRHYLRDGGSVGTHERPAARALDERAHARAVELFKGAARGNAVVVRQLLRDEGLEASARTVQRAVCEARQMLRAEQVATVRFETPPGRQMQIDFGQMMVSIAGQMVRVYFLAAVLGYSRRLFVKAFLAERHDDWREGVAGAFRRFGGVPHEVLGDNAGALVLKHDRVSQTLVFHPGWVAFCRDWDVVPKACAPYRARTKGKTESGVKYVKRNAIAGRAFDSFAALEAHLEAWMDQADARVHGTTHEVPRVRFERDERAALRPLPARPLPVRERRIKRRVSNDAFVDVDTVRYSVPHALIRVQVEVLVDVERVDIFRAGALVATHTRSREPHAKVTEPSHRVGLLRSPAETTAPSNLAAFGRDLSSYEDVVRAGGTR